MASNSKMAIRKSIIVRFLIVLLSGLLFVACSKDDDLRTVSFMGDSIVARWDVKQFFPTLITENKGQSSSGIEYIESNAGRMKDKTAVVLYGTNDIQRFSDVHLVRYVSAIGALHAEKTIVISVLPRNMKGDAEDINQKICVFNNLVKEACTAHCWDYVDAYAVMQENGTIKWEYYTDGLHLSDVGYEILTYEIRKRL